MKIHYISKDEINIIIYKKDYDKLIKIKTIYDINEISYFGLEKHKRNILENKYIIISIMIAFIILYVLSNLIFQVEVITNDNDMKIKLTKSLEEYGIEKYKFKKNYNKLQYIKKQILSKYNDEIEWIEIENIGTKYIVRYEPRIITNTKKENEFRNIIAKKDAVIKELNVSSGQILKEVNTYVKKGDIIVSGYIYLNETVKDTVSSKGKILGEVWYTITVDYPFKYSEEIITGNKRNVFAFKFLNRYFEIFNFKKFETKKVNDKTILKNNLLPIKFVKQHQMETIRIEENYDEEKLIEKAIKYSNKKIQANLNEEEYISNYKILSKIKKENSIELSIFYSIVEDITEYQKIEEYVTE